MYTCTVIKQIIKTKDPQANILFIVYMEAKHEESNVMNSVQILYIFVVRVHNAKFTRKALEKIYWYINVRIVGE